MDVPFKKLPSFVWNLGQKQCCILLCTVLLYASKSCNIQYGESWTTDCAKYCDDTGHCTININYGIEMANDIVRLALHSGVSARIDKSITTVTASASGDKSCIVICCKNEPTVSSNRIYHKKYRGIMGCIEVAKTHNFYMRCNKYSPPVWIGNSSRAGQKSVVALLMKETEMPFTKDGMRPSIIFNPHECLCE